MAGRTRIPTSTELAEVPILGLFATMDASLGVLRNAILSAYQDIDEESAYEAAYHAKDHSFIMADAIVIAIDNLRCAIERYQSIT